MAREIGVSRPPTWLLGVAGGAVAASLALLVLAWRSDDAPSYVAGYVLGCIVTVVLVALYFQLDKRPATSTLDNRRWSGSVPAMRLLLGVGFLVGAAHAGLLAYVLARS